MTKEQLEIAVKLNRSLEQLKLILDCLNGRCKEELKIKSRNYKNDRQPNH